MEGEKRTISVAEFDCKQSEMMNNILCPICEGTKTSIIQMNCTYCCDDGILSDIGLIKLNRNKIKLEKLGIIIT